MADEMRFTRLLGLARRAGNLAVGTQAVELAVRRGQAQLVVLAEDAGPNTYEKVERFTRMCEVPLVRGIDRAEIEQVIGKRGAVVVAITDEAMAEGLRSALEGHAPSEAT